jgi:hypothetical protein
MLRTDGFPVRSGLAKNQEADPANAEPRPQPELSFDAVWQSVKIVESQVKGRFADVFDERR